jgi:pSer/pThr/pTyr-binding forkhead associated (FHA) protein
MLKKFFKKLSGKKEEEPSYERNKQFFKGDTPPSFPEETLIENVPRTAASKTTPAQKKFFNEIDVLINGEKISSYRVSDEGISVGRDPSKVGIIIAEPIISKLHCSFYRSGTNLKVIDHSSTNGIYLKGIKISEQVLEDGAVISLGKKGTVKLVVHNVRMI